MNPTSQLHLLMAFLIANGLCGSAFAAPLDDLPPGWKITRIVHAPPDQASAIGRRFGGVAIDRLTNTFISVPDAKDTLQVNVIELKSESGAQAFYGAFSKIKAFPGVILNGTRVIEFVCPDRRLVITAGYLLHLRPPSAHYKVRFDIATIADGDYMACNDLFNALTGLAANPGDADLQNRVHQLSTKFTFGDSISLRTLGCADGQPVFDFGRAAIASIPSDPGDITRFRFSLNGLPNRLDVPYVPVNGDIWVHALSPTPLKARRQEPSLTAATRRWPADDPEVVDLAKQVTAGCTTSDRKVTAILEWMLPGRNMKFGGAVTGSRYGVKETLKQRFGHCWDFADLFVTLCRAAQVPSREVAGWLYNSEGHVWAEVLTASGEAWQQVDPTAGMGCTTDCIPFFTTEDGEMPIVYASRPTIERF